MSQHPALILSAEHASDRVPARYRPLFVTAGDALRDHRAIDAGTAELGRRLARQFALPLHAATATRLLVDCNRSLTHPRVFSSFTRSLDLAGREQLIEHFYRPLRGAVENAVRRALGTGAPALHLSLHSFTPVLEGRVREADIGLLYDPASDAETLFCAHWQRALKASGLRVRRNYPYRGVSDGHVTGLRRTFAGQGYIGIELEINQALVFGEAARWRQVQGWCIESLRRTLAEPM